MKTATKDTIETAVFELKLPEPFKIEPEFIVELPAKCTASIYKAEMWIKDTEDYTKSKRGPGWRVIIRNRFGRVPQALMSNYNRVDSDETFSEPLNVTLYLRRVVTVLSKAKKTTTTDIDPEE